MKLKEYSKSMGICREIQASNQIHKLVHAKLQTIAICLKGFHQIRSLFSYMTSWEVKVAALGSMHPSNTTVEMISIINK